jgi:hypothetical protein
MVLTLQLLFRIHDFFEAVSIDLSAGRSRALSASAYFRANSFLRASEGYKQRLF